MKRLMDKVSTLEKGVSGIYEGVVRLDTWPSFQTGFNGAPIFLAKVHIRSHSSEA